MRSFGVVFVVAMFAAPAAGQTHGDARKGDDSTVPLGRAPSGAVCNAIADSGYVSPSIGTAGMTCRSINAASATISTLDVRIALNHTYIGDLTAKLVAPSGQIYTLFNRPGRTTSGFGYGANLGSGAPIYIGTRAATSAELAGSVVTESQQVCLDGGPCWFAPNTDQEGGPTLASLVGTNAGGTWQVCVGDSAGSDVGDLCDATLSINSADADVSGGTSSPYGVGEFQDYLLQLDLRNDGPATATRPTLVTTLPSAAILSHTCGAQLEVANGSATWTSASLAAGATAACAIRFDGAACEFVALRSFASADQPDADPVDNRGAYTNVALLMGDHDFEAAVGGDSPAWSETASPARPIICGPGTCPPTYVAASGSKYVWLGGSTSATDDGIEQSVDEPFFAPARLTFRYATPQCSAANGANDSAGVDLLAGVFRTNWRVDATASTCGSSTWRSHTIDGFRLGQAGILSFTRVQIDGRTLAAATPSSFLFDDFRYEAARCRLQPDAGISIGTSTAFAPPGAFVDVQLELRNDGETSLPSVTGTLVLPPELVLGTSTCSGSWNGNTLTRVVALAPLARSTCSVRVQVPANAALGERTLSGTVTSGMFDADPGDDAYTTSLEVVAPGAQSFLFDSALPTAQQSFVGVTTGQGNLITTPTGRLLLCGDQIQKITTSGFIIRSRPNPELPTAFATCLTADSAEFEYLTRAPTAPTLVAKYAGDGAFVLGIGPRYPGSGTQTGMLRAATDAVVIGDRILVLDALRRAVVTYRTTDGAYVSEFALPGFDTPISIVSGDAASVIVAGAVTGSPSYTVLRRHSLAGNVLAQADVMVFAAALIRGLDKRMYLSTTATTPPGIQVSIHEISEQLASVANYSYTARPTDAPFAGGLTCRGGCLKRLDAVDAEGNYFVVDAVRHGIRKLRRVLPTDNTLTLLETYALWGQLPDDIRSVRGVRNGFAGGYYVCSNTELGGNESTSSLRIIDATNPPQALSGGGFILGNPAPCSVRWAPWGTNGQYYVFDIDDTTLKRVIHKTDPAASPTFVDVAAQADFIESRPSDGRAYVVMDKTVTGYRVSVLDRSVIQTSWTQSATSPVQAAALDPDGNLVVAINKSTSVELQRWGPGGANLGTQTVTHPDIVGRTVYDVAIGPGGIVAFSVAESSPCGSTARVRVLSADLASVIFDPPCGVTAGSVFGGGPGKNLTFDAEGRLSIGEPAIGRISRFRVTAPLADSRAIVVAGGGPYLGNDLWDGTEASAGLAFRALAYQGYTKETVDFLSENPNNDLDGNGVFDDIAGPASQQRLQQSFADANAPGVTRLVVYLVDHGGFDPRTGQSTFRLNQRELLTATQLDQWLDAWEAADPLRRSVVIVDACESGRFVAALASPQRTVVTSTLPGQDARFLYNGSLSFSAALFAQLLEGADLGAAFTTAREVVEAAFSIGSGPLQTPLVDATGNGIGNEAADLANAALITIGRGTVQSSTRPTIATVCLNGTCSGAVAISGTAPVTIEAQGVAPFESIERVWAVLVPPAAPVSSSATPLVDYPTLELSAVSSGVYRATTSAFNEVGTYEVRVIARNGRGKTSLPAVRALTVSSPQRRKAVVAALGVGSARYEDLAASTDYSVRVLSRQGYGPTGAGGSTAANDETFYLRAGGVAGADATPTLALLQSAITTFAADTARDAIVHIVGEAAPGGILVRTVGGNPEILTPMTLAGWLNTLQATLPGTLVVVIDADNSAQFVQPLDAPSGKSRVVITSTGAGERAVFGRLGATSFSRALFAQILDGGSLAGAFERARVIAAFRQGNVRDPIAQIDDTGNGVANEELVDGVDYGLAWSTRLGSGLLLAGDPPYLEGLTLATTLNGESNAAIKVDRALATASVDEVYALVRTPAGTDTATVLALQPDGSYTGTLGCLSEAIGPYRVAVYARDPNGNLSDPLTAVVTQNAIGPCAPLPDPLFGDGFE